MGVWGFEVWGSGTSQEVVRCWAFLGVPGRFWWLGGVGFRFGACMGSYVKFKKGPRSSTAFLEKGGGVFPDIANPVGT